MKTFALYYDETINKEVIVNAKNEKTAIKKVREILGEDIQITNIWLVKRKKLIAVKEIK